MTNRTYNFDLPYTIDKGSVYWGYKKLYWDGMLAKLPADLQQRFTDAYNNSAEVVVTADELNEIDDDTWAQLASMLGVTYSN